MLFFSVTSDTLKWNAFCSVAVGGWVVVGGWRSYALMWAKALVPHMTLKPTSFVLQPLMHADSEN